MGRHDTHAQVAARRDAIRQGTERFARGEAYPPEVYRILAERGVEPNAAVLVEDRTPLPEAYPGSYAGLLLTADGRFMRFEVELEETPPLVCWQDTAIDTSARVRGIGTSEGRLAIEVFDALVEARVLRRPGAAPAPQVP